MTNECINTIRINFLCLSSTLFSIIRLLSQFKSTLKSCKTNPCSKYYQPHFNKLEKTISFNKIIPFLLPAFTAKLNFGDVLSLKTLNSICEKLNALYSYGIELIICIKIPWVTPWHNVILKINHDEIFTKQIKIHCTWGHVK
jgi:hypothetical protein